MEIDYEHVGEVALAFLFFNRFREKPVTRAWKSIPWEVMDRLFERGFISDPKSKAKSVVMTDEGLREAERMFEKHMVLEESDGSAV